MQHGQQQWTKAKEVAEAEAAAAAVVVEAAAELPINKHNFWQNALVTRVRERESSCLAREKERREKGTIYAAHSSRSNSLSLLLWQLTQPFVAQMNYKCNNKAVCMLQLQCCCRICCCCCCRHRWAMLLLPGSLLAHSSSRCCVRPTACIMNS